MSAPAPVSEAPVQLQSVRAHRGEVTCADASGARLVTGGDRALRLWRWAAGGGWAAAGEAAPAPAHRYGVTAARWSPRGQLVASGGVDGAVRVWREAAGEGGGLVAARVLAAPGAGAVRALCWGGALLVGAHDEGAARVWRWADGALLARLGAHEEALRAVAAPAGALLFTACSAGVLKVFDMHEVVSSGVEAGAGPAPLLWEAGAHDLGALCADASRDGGAVATGGQDGLVRVWRVERAGAGARGVRRARAAGALAGHGGGVTGLRWGARGVLASASLDRTARVWARGACVCVLRAHARYLTCVVLAPDLRYIITGSNDRTVRTWSLGALTLDDELEPPCSPGAHFGLGDLEGIEPIETDDLLGLESSSNSSPEPTDEGGGGAVRRVWSSRELHSGAVNCIATHGDLLATASSDGTVRVLRWDAARGRAEPQGAVGAAPAAGPGRAYPALGADLGAGGALLLSAGLDGAALLTDVQTGLTLRTLSAPHGEEGAGGVRAVRVSPHRPPLLLLATDAGAAPLWSLADPDPRPIHVYAGHEAAVLCCAWGGTRLCATGGAGGELRVHAAPPHARTLLHVNDAHDLGVQSCDFAAEGAALGLGEQQLLLATAGRDALLKLWLLDLDEDWNEDSGVRMRVVRTVEAHGGGVTCVRWGAGGAAAVLASGGGDRWARVWRVARGGASVRPAGAVPTSGALAVALLGEDLLVLGTLTGELAVWRRPPVEGEGEEEGEGGADGEASTETDDADTQEDMGVDVRWWGVSGTVRWLREYVTCVPGVSAAGAARLAGAARAARVAGARLLDAPLAELLADLGLDAESEESEESELNEIRARLREEVYWLRREEPRAGLEWSAPHALLCPLTHRVLQAPVRAADGLSYERAALLERRAADGGLVSPVTGRRLRNARLAPNHALAARLRAFLRDHDAPDE